MYLLGNEALEDWFGRRAVGSAKGEPSACAPQRWRTQTNPIIASSLSTGSRTTVSSAVVATPRHERTINPRTSDNLFPSPYQLSPLLAIERTHLDVAKAGDDRTRDHKLELKKEARISFAPFVVARPQAHLDRVLRSFLLVKQSAPHPSSLESNQTHLDSNRVLLQPRQLLLVRQIEHERSLLPTLRHERQRDDIYARRLTPTRSSTKSQRRFPLGERLILRVELAQER